MPRFRYSGRDTKGIDISGEMDAASESDIAAILMRQRITPTRIHLESRPRAGLLGLNGRLHRIGTRDFMRLSKRLYYLLHAGMDLNRALLLLETQQKSRHIASFLAFARAQIQAGKTLTSALAESGQPLPAYLVGILQAGETSGSLDHAFKSINSLLERQFALREKLISALIYPAILFVASILTIVVLATTVVPRFEPFFEQAGANLPAITSFVVAVAEIVQVAWLPLLLALGAALLLWTHLVRSEIWRVRLHWWLLRLPFAGALLRKAGYGRIANLWSIQLAGGVPLTQAMRQSLNGIGNWQIRGVVAQALNQIVAGQSLAKAMSRKNGVPELFVEFADLGEQTGRLSETLGELATIFSSEIDDDLQRGLSLITPVATLVLGGMVATVLVALLSAVLAVNDLAV